MFTSLNLTRALLCLDVEATGTDPQAEAIFEVGLVLLRPDGTQWSGIKRFKPWKPIPAEVEELTHTTNADVEHCEPFSAYAERLAKTIAGKDLAGYNLTRYDLPLIDAELRRCGFKLDLTGVSVVDAYGIFCKKHPRKLVDAVRVYCGQEAADEFVGKAHGADADSAATLGVLKGQVAAHEDLRNMTVEQLAEFSRQGEHNLADLAGKLYWDEAGELRFNFGKNQGKLVREDLAYCRWMRNGNFPGSTMETLAVELERLNLRW